MPNSCCICGLTKGKEKEISMFQFPSNETKCQSWLAASNMNPSEISEHSRVCSSHFLNGDSSNPPSLNLGRKFFYSYLNVTCCNRLNVVIIFLSMFLHVTCYYA